MYDAGYERGKDFQITQMRSSLGVRKEQINSLSDVESMSEIVIRIFSRIVVSDVVQKVLKFVEIYVESFNETKVVEHVDN
jgi:hypothetical protein